MKSPFPGMDPYLEAHWGDVHNSLMTYTRNQLQRQLPKDLRARVEEQVTVEDEQAEGRRQRWRPDVRVVERPNGNAGRGPATAAGLLVAEPLVVEWEEESAIQRSVHIIDTRSGHRLVTAIEFLSPTNKTDSLGRGAYRRKQSELRRGGVSLVEVDLLRAGDYILAVPPGGLPPDFREPYRICVTRGWKLGSAELYRVPLRERLPVIRVPLRESDPDVFLDLQALIDAAYADGGYEDIDYTEDPDPPLTGDDAAWADELLRQQGKR